MLSQVLQRQGVSPRDYQRERGAFGNDKGVTRHDTKYTLTTLKVYRKGIAETHEATTNRRQTNL